MYALTQGGALTAEWAHVGSYFTDPENAHRYEGYHLLNLYANAPVTRQVSVVGRLNNVTDTRYAVTASFNPFVPPAFQARYGPGMPRSFFFGLQYGWRQ